MSKPAARAGDPTAHGGALEPTEGVPNVRVNGQPVWVAPATHSCAQHGPEGAPGGSESVKIGKRRILREGDYLLGAGAPDRINQGSPNVVVGTPLFGVASAENIKKFCAGYCALRRDWAKLTPDERRARYAELVGGMFDTFGAPPPRITDHAPKDTGGTFSGSKWELALPEGAFESSTPIEGPATLHEIRHGEQFFGGLRDLAHPPARDGAGETPSADDLESQLEDVQGGVHPPKHVLEAAVNTPLDRKSAEGRWARVMGAEVYTEEGIRAQRKVIQDYHRAAAISPEEGNRAYEAYQKRPYGEDALAIEGLGNCGGCK